MPNIGLIGAGLMGQKRAAHLAGARLVAVCDVQRDRAEALAGSYGAEVESDWERLIARKDIEIVCVSVTHDQLARCAAAAAKAGKHVLVEKPGGRTPEEIQSIIDVARQTGIIVRVGFNHRFHPAFQKAKEILKAPVSGPLMYIRARYGHGGRVGYEKEWRADKAVSGGGELLDQGIHLIDLCRWLGGEFDAEWGKTKTFFWPMAVEDNAFLYLESPDKKRSAFLHASWSEWKNLFNFEIFARHAKLEVSGLGKSYGTEELKVYQMKPAMGPPALESTPFPGDDISWSAEFAAFLQEIKGQSTDIATLEDAKKALAIVTKVYACNV